jgi:hypothetical protein
MKKFTEKEKREMEENLPPRLTRKIAHLIGEHRRDVHLIPHAPHVPMDETTTRHRKTRPMKEEEKERFFDKVKEMKRKGKDEEIEGHVVKIPIRQKHTLSVFGYHVKKSDKSRHESLIKALETSSPLEINRKLNALSTLNKNKNPKYSLKFKADAKYILTYGKKSMGQGLVYLH